jgi:hypothetical protein
MEGQIRDRVCYNRGIRVDGKYLSKLESLIQNEWQDFRIEVTVYYDNVELAYKKYSDFESSIEEELNEIEKIKMEYYKEKSAYTNEIKIVYSNVASYFEYPIKVRYTISDVKEYNNLKFSIDKLIKANYLSYAFISRCPILLFLAAISVAILIVCGFFEGMQSASILIFILLLLNAGLSGTYSEVRKIKRRLFPMNELYFGVNKGLVEKGGRTRSIIGGTVILGIVVGIVVNLISRYITG